MKYVIFSVLFLAHVSTWASFSHEDPHFHTKAVSALSDKLNTSNQRESLTNSGSIVLPEITFETQHGKHTFNHTYTTTLDPTSGKTSDFLNLISSEETDLTIADITSTRTALPDTKNLHYISVADRKETHKFVLVFNKKKK